MIIDPDFLDHWRTRMLVDALQGDEQAPLYLIRIWAHCQSRRAASFEMPAGGLKALCRYPGDADALEHALITSGFIARKNGTVSVPKWAEKNVKLVANWENGQKGGKPKRNPTVTQSKPTPNQSETHSEPIREDKKEEKKESKSHSAARDPRLDHHGLQVIRELVGQYPKKTVWDEIILLLPEGFDEEHLRDCAKEWAKISSNMSNIRAWLFDWFVNGIPNRQPDVKGNQSVGKPGFGDKQNAAIRDAFAGLGRRDNADVAGVERRLQAPGASRGGTGVDEGELDSRSGSRPGPVSVAMLREGGGQTYRHFRPKRLRGQGGLGFGGFERGCHKMGGRIPDPVVG